MGTGGGNYTSTTPGASISIDARDETPDAYRFYPSEVSKLYSQMKGVPFSPLVAPPKEATYIDSMQPRKIKSQLYAKDGTYVNAYANGGVPSYMKDAIHMKYYGMPTAPLRMGINAADKFFGNRPILGGITNALSGGLNRMDDFTRSLLDKETYKQRNEQANEQANEQVNELVNEQANEQVNEQVNEQENEQTNKRRMELPRFQQDRDAIFQENVEAFRDRDSTQMMADGGFPEREELVTGPGGEKGDKIPAMLSDGEFIFNSAAVRGMGIMSGASPDDEYEQRLMGARKMYEFQKEAEEMAIWIVTGKHAC
jgi:archaellum component FlaD/FlaE